MLNYLGRKFGLDAHYFVSNSFLIAANQSIAIIGSLVVTVVFAHHLSEELFGNYRYLITLASIFSVFSLNSIGQSILQTAAQGKTWFFLIGIRYSLISNLLCIAISMAAGLYYFINDNSLLALSCIAIALFQPLISTFFNIYSYLHGLSLYKESAGLQIFRVVCITVSSLLAIYLTQSVLILFIVYLIAQTVSGYIGYWYFKPHTIEKPDSVLTRKYLNFATHLSIQNAILAIAIRIDTLIVFQFLGGAALATYAIAQIVPDQLKSMVKNFSTLLFPKYVNYSSEKLLRSIPGRSLQLFVILVLITLCYILVAPFIIGWLLPKYETAILYTQLLALAIPASVLYIVQSAIKSQTNNVQLYYIQFSHATIKVLLVFVGIYYFSIWGAVGAYILSSYVELALYYGVYFSKPKQN